MRLPRNALIFGLSAACAGAAFAAYASTDDAQIGARAVSDGRRTDTVMLRHRDGKQPGTCDNLLQLDRLQISTDYSFRLAYLQSINAQNFSQAQQNAEFSSMLPELPVGASYSDFEQHRSNLLQTTGISISERQRMNLLQTGLPDTAINAFVDCVRSDQREMRVRVATINPRTVTFSVERISRIYHRDARVIVSAEGGDIVGARSRLFRQGGQTVFTVARRNLQPMTVTFRLVSGNSNQIDATAIDLPAYRQLQVRNIREPLQGGLQALQCGGGGSESPTSTTQQIPVNAPNRRFDRSRAVVTPGAYIGDPNCDTPGHRPLTAAAFAFDAGLRSVHINQTCGPLDARCSAGQAWNYSLPMVEERIVGAGNPPRRRARRGR